MKPQIFQRPTCAAASVAQQLPLLLHVDVVVCEILFLLAFSFFFFYFRE